MTENQAIGSFLGLAIGDALGTTLEFSQNPTEDRSKWHRHITGGGPFQLPAGGWTDDTSMALAMAEAIVSQGQFDANAVADNFVAWWQDGKFSCQRECFDIGFTTSEALARFNANANNANPYQGSTAPSTSGNGGIMRLVPTVIANLHDQNKAVTESVLQSRITHASPECDLYAGLLAQVLVAADPLIPEVEAYVLDDKTPWHRLPNSGYVKDTFQTAMWAARTSNSFEECLVLAVNRQGDADTIGAVAGQIAGAMYGIEGIPEHWLGKLAWREHLYQVAKDLYCISNKHYSTA